MPRKKQNHTRCEEAIGEQIRIAVNLTIKKFLKTEEQKELEFPSSLTAIERAYVHQLARDLGLHSKSRGKGAGRYLTVFKREGSSIVQADATFQLHPTARAEIITLLARHPLTTRERQELLPPTERDRALSPEPVKDVNKTLGRLMNGCPQVPEGSVSQELLPFRQSLPVWGLRDEIVDLIGSNPVVVISGDTGSGKTTQVPQFVIDDCMAARRPCRVVCTQPRRISAVTVAERVAAERDDKVGNSVGYQIRLEGRASPRTVLTYCTDGVLLRTLMTGDAGLATITHIIIDEVHERNRFCDFLLIALRDALSKFRSLRLILMSATADTSLFSKYFNNCPVITVPGRQFEVEERFLEDILKSTKYLSAAMVKAKEDIARRMRQRQKLEQWTRVALECVTSSESQEKGAQATGSRMLSTEDEPWVAAEMDRLLAEAWLHGSQDAMAQLMTLVTSERTSVDYQHSETSLTPLMVAAGRGYLEVAEQLLSMGASVGLRASNDWTALDYARHMRHPELEELLAAYLEAEPCAASTLIQQGETAMGTEEQQLLDVYLHSVSEESIDFDLVVTLLLHINASSDMGGILVFLAGYDDIVNLRERLMVEDSRLVSSYRFTLYTLHSNMQTNDQKRVFRPAPPGTRKIILATNIAETSITIDDVVYVVDCGKVKEKSFDSVSGVCQLRPEWISQACAKQRAGRAGRTRPGVCYHMFSRMRYASFQKFHTPEILRLPLQELCLHTKLLAPPNTPIADFLARAIEPPAFVVTRNAVQLLKTMDALDPWEDLTELGHHLLDLSVEPQLGKALLYSVVLKCLDPVLTIVCCLAHRDPFVLPTRPIQKRVAWQSRRSLSAGTFSDHMVLLRAFQGWQHARASGFERAFCERNLVSAASMETVLGLRTQLLGQLRASGFVRARGGGDIRDLNTNSENWAVVKGALSAGLYPNLVRVDREANQLRTQREFRVLLHPSSVLRGAPGTSHSISLEGLPSDWLLYQEMSRSGRLCHVRCCTVVPPVTVALFAGPGRLPLDAVTDADANGSADRESDSEVEERPDSQTATLKLDEWAVFRLDADVASLTHQLRQKWNSLFLRRMRCPSKPWSQVDDAVVKAIVTVVNAEEGQLGLPQPVGVGQRPKIMTVDFFPPTGNRRGMEEEDRTVRMLELSPKGTEQSDSGSPRSTESQTPSPPPGGSRYFIIKAGNTRSVEASLVRGAWALTPTTERKAVKALREGRRVVLVFSVQGSGHFQGFARLLGDRPLPDSPDLAGPGLGSPLPIEWLKRANIPFQATRHLSNPYNESKRVQTSRDGQEVEPGVGEALCTLWDKFPSFVPKAGANRGNDDKSHGRPIRGFSHFGSSVAQYNNGMSRTQPAK